MSVEGTASGNCAGGFGFETVTSILHITGSPLQQWTGVFQLEIKIEFARIFLK